MAIETPHKHIGFNVQFDGLIQRGSIHINPLDWEGLHLSTATAVKLEDVDDATLDTRINATTVGPVSGPDAGTGPLVPVHTAVTKEILPFNPLDAKPNALSPELEAAQDDKATVVVTDQDLAPYPTGDAPAVPTTVDPPAVEPLVPEAENPDTELEPVPLPEHPAVENEPETPEHAYLREEEAKGE